MSDTTTRGVRIRVTPRYLPEQSSPERGHYLFGYRVEIVNEGLEAVRLLTRHWIITNGEGTTEDIRGDGVVGQQPRLEPGERFDYTSACPLTTPVGTMHGSYQMITDDGTAFDAAIQPFRLAVPRVLN